MYQDIQGPGPQRGKVRPTRVEKTLKYLQPGDVLVLWKLDRLGRSLQDLLNIVNDLGKRGVGFMSLTEGFDSTTPNGKLIFSIFGGLAEFERAIIRERVNAGLDAARARGVTY